jgi:hypothetical protein
MLVDSIISTVVFDVAIEFIDKFELEFCRVALIFMAHREV